MTKENLRAKAVTLKDIAHATGFSVNTVSRALSDRADISLETKELIRDKATELGYIANAMASFLRSGVSRIVAIIVGDISNPHFSVILKETQILLQRKGYTCIIFNTEEKAALERQAITTSISQNVDGILICPSPNSQDNIRFLQSHQTPFVLVGRRFNELETNYVVCDDEQGGYIATKYLLDNGHTRILFLNGPRGISSTAERLRGYQKALAEYCISYDAGRICTVPITADTDEEKVKRILRNFSDCTAILAFSDLIAWRAISLLEQEGLHVPCDYSVIGFDNVKFIYPLKLTSISSSKITMAKKAVDILLKGLSGTLTSKECTVLETRLVEGDTVSPPNCS